MRSHVLWEGEFISSNAPHKAKCVLGFQRYTRQLRSSLFSNLCWEGHLFWMQNIYHGYSGVSWNLVHQSRCSERLSPQWQWGQGNYCKHVLCFSNYMTHQTIRHTQVQRRKRGKNKFEAKNVVLLLPLVTPLHHHTPTPASQVSYIWTIRCTPIFLPNLVGKVCLIV